VTVDDHNLTAGLCRSSFLDHITPQPYRPRSLQETRQTNDVVAIITVYRPRTYYSVNRQRSLASVFINVVTVH